MIVWNQLRAIGNSPIAKSAIIVPVLGYFILFNDEIVKWLRLHTELCRPNECNLLWRLICLYFGGCAFALGAILYGLFCPSQIKKYADAADYLSGERDVFAAHPERGNKDRLPATVDEEAKNLQRHAEESRERLRRSNRADATPKPRGYDEQVQMEIAINSQLSYNGINRTFPLLRGAIAVLYIAGALLLATPSVWTFGEVVARLLRLIG